MTGNSSESAEGRSPRPGGVVRPLEPQAWDGERTYTPLAYAPGSRCSDA